MEKRILREYSAAERKKDAARGLFYPFAGNTYKIIGYTKNGKRFRYIYADPHIFLGINLWKGRKYVKYVDEKTFRLIQEIC